MEKYIFSENFKYDLCKKLGHKNKKMEYICTLPSCSERFHCAVCILNDHFHHFSSLQLIDQFIIQLNEKQQQKTSVPRNFEEEIKKMTENLDEDQEILKIKDTLSKEEISLMTELESLEIFIEEEIRNNFEKFEEKQEKALNNFEKLLNDMKKELDSQQNKANKTKIENLLEFEDYLNKKFMANDSSLTHSHLLKLYCEYKAMRYGKSMIKNIMSIENFNNKFENLIKWSHNDIKTFAFHCMKVFTPSSNLDIKKIKNTRVIETDHKKSIYKVLFLEDEQKIVTASDDSTICIWNFSSGKLLNILQGHSERIWTMIKFGNNQLVSGGSDHKIILWSLNDNKCENVLLGHSNYVCALLEMPNNILLSGSQDKTIRMWNMNDKKCLKVIKPEGQGRIMAIVLNSVTSEIISGSENIINFININEGNVTKFLKGHSHLIRDLLLVNINCLLSASDDKTLRMWNIEKETCLKTFNGHTYSANKIVYLRKGIVCTCSDDESIKFWDIEKMNATPYHSLLGHIGWVIYITVMSDGSLVSVGADKKIRIWTN